MIKSTHTFYPTYVDNDIDLKCAINTKKVVIISSDKKLFVELESKFKKKKAASATKKNRVFHFKSWHGIIRHQHVYPRS